MPAGASLDVDRAYLRARAQTIGTHSRFKARDEPARPVIVRTDDGRAIWQEPIEELLKSLHNTLKGTVGIEVVRLDVGHHGHRRFQLQERSVVFVRLDHIEIATATKVTTPSGHAAADEAGRIHPRRRENLRGHRRRGGLAVCTRDCQYPTLIDPLAQGFRSLENRNPSFERLLHLWVVLGTAALTTRAAAPLYVARLVPLVYLYIQGPEPVRARSRP